MNVEELAGFWGKRVILNIDGFMD